MACEKCLLQDYICVHDVRCHLNNSRSGLVQVLFLCKWVCNWLGESFMSQGIETLNSV